MMRRAIAAVWLLAILSPAGEAAPRFVISTLDAGVAQTATVAWMRLGVASRADLLVVTVTAHQRRLRVYAQEAKRRFQPHPVATFPLPADAILLDTGRLRGRDALVLFTATQAIAFDPLTGAETPLVTFASIFNVPLANKLPQMNLFRDLNGDGRDDFAIPDFSGYEIFLQRKDGSFAPPVHLAAPPEMHLEADNQPAYRARKLFLADMTRDGRPDIVFWRDDGFAIYRQRPDGSFSDVPTHEPSTLGIGYDSYQDFSNNLQGRDQSNLTAKVLYRLVDLDGDGMPELVVLTVKSGGVFKKRTRYEIYHGIESSHSDLVSFAPEPTSTISSGGIQFDLRAVDLDANGQQDLMVSSVHLGLARIIAALITHAVPITLDFYRMKHGVYDDSPNVSRRITATFSLSSGEVFYPTVLVADVDGDHYADLLAQKGNDTLQVYSGHKGRGLFDRRPTDIRVALPSDPARVQLADLDGDGKRDLVIRLGKPGRDHKVEVLMAE